MEGTLPMSQRRAQILGRLRQRKSRVREGLVLVEGLRAGAEALDAGAEVRFAVTSPRLRETPAGSAFLTRIFAAGTEVNEVSDRELENFADTEHPQGVLLVCPEPVHGASAVVAGGRYLVLDALQDPGNAGTLVRAAVAFGLTGVVALDGTVDLWGAKAVRASAGMVFKMPVVSMTAADATSRFNDVGVPVLVADSGGADVTRWSGGPSWALVVGNEGNGPREAVRDAADGTIRVPMPGSAESLNAGVAGSILLFALTTGDDDQAVDR